MDSVGYLSSKNSSAWQLSHCGLGSVAYFSASQPVGREAPSGGPRNVPRQLKYFFNKVIG